MNNSDNLFIYKCNTVAFVYFIVHTIRATYTYETSVSETVAKDTYAYQCQTYAYTAQTTAQPLINPTRYAVPRAAA